MVHQMAIPSILEKDKYLKFSCVLPNYHLVNFHESAEWYFGGRHKNCKYMFFQNQLNCHSADYTQTQTQMESEVF